MTALTFAVLSLTAMEMARRADSKPGDICLRLIACFLFAASLMNADWEWLT